MLSYSKISDNFFNYTYKWRSKYFRPFLKFLDKAGVKPNDISFFRLIFILPLGYFLFYDLNIFWAANWYLLFWLFDTFDGALARYQDKSSDRGKFIDLAVDVFVHSFMLVGLINYGFSPVIISYQILIHLTLYLLAIVKKQEGKKTDWIINPKPDQTYLKLSGNIILALYAYFTIDFVNSGFLIINIVMSLIALYYFYKIYRK